MAGEAVEEEERKINIENKKWREKPWGERIKKNYTSMSEEYKLEI
jgi:hypothetical protein